MDDVFFLVLEERAEGGVNDTFGRAGRARGVEDVEWVGWWKVSEGECSMLVWHADEIRSGKVKVGRNTHQVMNSS